MPLENGGVLCRDIHNHQPWTTVEVYGTQLMEPKGFYAGCPAQLEDSWDALRLPRGFEQVGVIFEDGSFVIVWVDSTHICRSNMNRHKKKKWKRRLLEVASREDNQDE